MRVKDACTSVRHLFAHPAERHTTSHCSLALTLVGPRHFPWTPLGCGPRQSRMLLVGGLVNAALVSLLARGRREDRMVALFLLCSLRSVLCLFVVPRDCRSYNTPFPTFEGRGTRATRGYTVHATGYRLAYSYTLNSVDRTALQLHGDTSR